MLSSLALPILLASLSISIVSVSLPKLTQLFAASFQAVQWVVLGYLLAVTTVIVSMGRLGDLFGRRRLLMIGVSLFTLASACCAVAPTLILLIAARVLQGLGAAVMMALSMAFVGDTVAKEETGRAMGLLGTLSAVGTALGPTLGGFLLTHIGWQAIFLINLPLGVLTLWLVWRYLPSDPARSDSVLSKFNYGGTFLLALTLAAYALSMTMNSRRAHFTLLNHALLLLAVLAACLLVVHEKRSTAPLIPFGLFSNPVFTGGFLSSMLVTTVVMSSLVVGPFYLSGALLLSTDQVGLVMSCGPIVSALTGVPAGRVVDKFGAIRISLCGLMIMLMGCTGLSLLPAHFGVLAYCLPLMLLTAGYATFQAANNTLVMTQSFASQRGVMAGLLNLSRNLGLITGASMMAAVFADASITREETVATVTGLSTGMHTCFALAAALILLALLLTFASRLRLQKMTLHGINLQDAR